MTLKSGIDLNNLDRSVKPTEDFFNFVNGTWLKNNPIPPDETRWGSFSILVRDSDTALKDILESLLTSDFLAGSDAKKLKDFYTTGMDESKLNQEGIAPLQQYLAKIDQISDLSSLMTYVVWAHQRGISAFWNMGVDQDLRDSELNSMYLAQGGISLPDRDYYFKDDTKSLEIIEKYRDHLVKSFQMLGENQEQAEKSARTVFVFEKRLAKASMNRTERRDLEKLYNKMLVTDISSDPMWSLTSYFSQLGLADLKEVIVEQPVFFEELRNVILEGPIEDIKTYLRWHLFKGACSFLSDDFVNHAFDFYGRVLGGATDLKPRWRRCAGVVEGSMGEALGRLYVEKHFSAEAKAKINEIVDHLMIAYRKRIENLDWMSAETKEKTLVKLNAVVRMLGYPDKWRDYSALEIGDSSYLENVGNASYFETKRNLNKYGKPVDRTEWLMTPSTVNAYYSPTTNQIVFPAGIMQPPFFDAQAYEAVNYAGIGAVIGHELTHGFDDQGSKFDERGSMQEWWTKEDREKFEAKSQKVVEQFDDYIAVDNLHVQGKLTLGENIADLGGLSIAFDAFQEHMREHGRPEQIDGFTPEQMFFMGWAQIWRQNIREEQARNFVMTDSHSPTQWRVNGPLSNLPEFYQAFECKEGDALWRPEDQRAKIW